MIGPVAAQSTANSDRLESLSHVILSTDNLREFSSQYVQIDHPLQHLNPSRTRYLLIHTNGDGCPYGLAYVVCVDSMADLFLV
jgi:hypothetical protein